MGRLFGTDGVRGVANEQLTCELAMKLGRAAATVISGNQRRHHPKFVVGMDTRISSRMLASSVIAGLCSVGADVIDLDVISTPAVAYLIGKYKADAGIMISASHNTFEYNGIKIFSGDGYKLPDALEERIESMILDEKASPVLPIGSDIGTVRQAENAIKDYVDHLKSTVPFSLSGMKIAVDCANGSASKTAQKLFKELDADCHIIFSEPNGQNINDGCGSTHPETLQKYVVENGLDVGVAFDGDADRCFCVDDKGNLVDGDFIMAICALDMKKRGKLAHNSIVGTILTNMGFIKFCENNDISFVATKVGDRFVLEQMLLEDFNFGGEQSGHVIFRDFATTGDGQLTAIQLLSQLKRTGSKLSDLTGCMRKFPQIQINVRVSPEGKIAFYTDFEVNDAISAAKKELGDDGRLVVRASGTEPLMRVMTEHQNYELAESVAKKVANVIEAKLGKV
ncbi:MAG: phosphoglucosamine mutase [Ruminococcaceae bacterium]|nr:phosphoglucosamine mutase [Oscillospiraceae bacterium]